MFLLNSDQIQACVKSARGHRLDIEPFEVSGLQHTSYYFRLGDAYERESANSGARVTSRLSNEQPILTLEAHEYVRVWSYEQFMLDKTVLGIFGSLSDLAEAGLLLAHSPFIDPLYPNTGVSAPLELGITNLRSRKVDLRLGQRIGKVSFFDISDTYPVRLIPGSASEDKFQERASGPDS